MNRIVIDARNLLCPLPVIRTQDAVAACQTGDVLKVLCTDPGAMYDIPAWCRVHGHTVGSITRHDREIHIDVVVMHTESP